MWANFLIWIAGPIAIRVLTTLGLGVVSFTGFTAVLAFAYNSMQASFSGLPADAMSLLFLSGMPQGMAIILSALSARIALAQVSKIQSVI